MAGGAALATRSPWGSGAVGGRREAAGWKMRKGGGERKERRQRIDRRMENREGGECYHMGEVIHMEGSPRERRRISRASPQLHSPTRPNLQHLPTPRFAALPDASTKERCRGLTLRPGHSGSAGSPSFIHILPFDSFSPVGLRFLWPAAPSRLSEVLCFLTLPCLYLSQLSLSLSLSHSLCMYVFVCIRVCMCV